MVDSSASKASADEPKGTLASWLLPVVVTLAAYAAVSTVGFVWDDQSLILGSHLVAGRSALIDHLVQPFWGGTFQSARSFYRPLITLSYAADFRLWRGWPGGFHLTNLVLHTISAVLVGRLCLRAGASPTVAGLLASAFATFPRLTESVVWISGRTDVAAGVLTLGALLVYLSGWERWRRALAGLLLLLGLFCKEVALAGVVALALYEWHSSGRSRGFFRVVRELAPILVALVLYVTVRFAVMHGKVNDQEGPERTVANVLLASTEAIARYCIMLADPLRPRLLIGSLEHLQPALAAVGALVLMTLLVALFRYARRGTSMQWMAFGLGAAAIVAVLHIVPFQVNIVVADRFLYLPVAALAVFAAPVVDRLFQRYARLVLISGGLALSLFAITTSMRVRTWTNDVALWREEVAHVGSSNAIGYGELGIALIHRARYADALRVLDSQDHGASTNLITGATCLDKLGRRAEAMALLRALVQREPSRSLARLNLMLMATRERRFDEARAIADDLPAELKERSDVQALRRQVEDAAVEWGRFPTEEPDERVALRAARATWFERLGAVPEATARWRSVVLDATVDESTLLRAAAYLVGQGTVEQARAALAVLVQRSVAPTLISSLEETLASRFEDE